MPTLQIKILTVEDDALMADLVGNILEYAGYTVVHFFNANRAIEWLKGHKADLIISDIGLPGISGTQFCKLVKSDPATASIPMIMLTALGDEAHKVQSLKAGADDYVVKPFSNKEFLARVEALLRRCYHLGRTDKVFRSGALTLAADTGEVSIGEESVVLLPKEFALLLMFLAHKGHMLGYAFIRESVWGSDSIATRDTIKVTIHRLKAKLGDYASCITPVSGVGYKWIERE